MSTSYHQNRIDDKDSDGIETSSINRERESEKASNDENEISI